MSRFLVVEGPGKGTLYEPAGEASVGRGHACGVRLVGRHISRVHAKVRRVAEGLEIVDAESRNGIFVNGRKVLAHLLQPDDEIEIGEFILVFEPSFDFAGGIPEERPRTVARVRESVGDPFAEDILEREHLKLIVDTLRLLHDLDDERAILKGLLERVMAHVPAKRGFVMLSEGGGRLVPAVKHAPPEMDEFHVSNVLHYQVSREHRALVGTDLGKVGPIAGEPLSVLCAPLLARERYLGFVYLDGPAGSTAFGKTDLLFVAVLARFTAALVAARPAQDTPPEEVEWKSVEA